jgi:hypothetical protein
MGASRTTSRQVCKREQDREEDRLHAAETGDGGGSFDSKITLFKSMTAAGSLQP